MYIHLLQIVIAIGFGLYAALLTADTLSDQLIVLNNDGVSYTAQHTLATEGELVVLALPTERISLTVQFSGPEKTTFAEAHRLAGGLVVFSLALLIMLYRRDRRDNWRVRA